MPRHAADQPQPDLLLSHPRTYGAFSNLRPRRTERSPFRIRNGLARLRSLLTPPEEPHHSLKAGTPLPHILAPLLLRIL